MIVLMKKYKNASKDSFIFKKFNVENLEITNDNIYIFLVFTILHISIDYKLKNSNGRLMTVACHNNNL